MVGWWLSLLITLLVAAMKLVDVEPF